MRPRQRLRPRLNSPRSQKRRIPRRGLARFGLVTFWCATVVAALVAVEWMPILPRSTGLSYILLLVWEFTGYAVAAMFMAGLVFLFVATRALSRAANQAAQDAAVTPAAAGSNSAHPITAQDT